MPRPAAIAGRRLTDSAAGRTAAAP